MCLPVKTNWRNPCGGIWLIRKIWKFTIFISGLIVEQINIVPPREDVLETLPLQFFASMLDLMKNSLLLSQGTTGVNAAAVNSSTNDHPDHMSPVRIFLTWQELLKKNSSWTNPMRLHRLGKTATSPFVSFMRKCFLPNFHQSCWGELANGLSGA